MANDSYLTRQITFKIFDRKELSKNKRIDIRKRYQSMDAFDQDRNFWNLMSAPVQSDRGYYSRKIPLTPLVWKNDDQGLEDLALLGDLNKRPLNDIVENVKDITSDISVNNGFVDLRKIDWSAAFEEEENAQKEAEIKAAKKSKYKMIEENKKDGKNNLSVKK